MMQWQNRKKILSIDDDEKMRIVMLNGQNHKGSTYHIGRMIADKIPGDNEIREFFFPRDLNHFCIVAQLSRQKSKIFIMN